MLEGKF